MNRSFLTAAAAVASLAIGVAGWVFRGGDARQQVLGEIEHLTGTQASAALKSVDGPSITAHGTRDVHKRNTTHELAELQKAVALLPKL